MRTMRRTYQITAVGFILFAAFIAREAVELKFYTSLGPGPGFFPLWLSGILAFLAAIMFYQATWRRPESMPQDFFPSRLAYFRMGAILAALISVVILMDPMGFRLTMLAFLLFLLFALGRVNIFVTILAALGGSFGAYQVFVEMLKVPLPIGMFGI